MKYFHLYIHVGLVFCLWCLSYTLASSQQCDIINDPDVHFFDIRLPEVNVPSDLTTYICQDQPIPLPMDISYHAVAFEPLIDNTDIMHHMLLFGCPEPKTTDPHFCGGADSHCRSFLVQWSMGIEGQICSFPDTGVRFGLNSFQSMSLQIHWNNANQTSGMSDTSGVRVYYTKKLKKYDVGNVQVGQYDLEIPEGQGHWRQSGDCSSDCTKKWLGEPIYLTRAHIHMHYLGDGGLIELVRDGKIIQQVVKDDTFDYNKPPAHYFDDPVEVLPGDAIKVTCFFNSRDGVKSRNRTVYYGEGSDGEMCYAFITYYPKADGFDQCIQFDRYDICDAETYDVEGCVSQGFANAFDTQLAGEILQHCTTNSTSMSNRAQTLCTEKCNQAIETVIENPCMQGRVGMKTVREFLSEIPSWDDVRQILDDFARHCED